MLMSFIGCFKRLMADSVLIKMLEFMREPQLDSSILFHTDLPIRFPNNLPR